MGQSEDSVLVVVVVKTAACWPTATSCLCVRFYFRKTNPQNNSKQAKQKYVLFLHFCSISGLHLVEGKKE
jgi:hypothetical protein